MTDIDTAGRPARPGRVGRSGWWAWPVAVVVDLALGYVAALFLYLLWLQLAWWAGWAEPDPTWNDGTAATVVLLVPGVLISCVFVAVTVALTSFSGARAVPLVCLSLACYLSPLALILLRPDWWSAVRWY